MHAKLKYIACVLALIEYSSVLAWAECYLLTQIGTFFSEVAFMGLRATRIHVNKASKAHHVHITLWLLVLRLDLFPNCLTRWQYTKGVHCKLWRNFVYRQRATE